jgi:hypothetical protein
MAVLNISQSRPFDPILSGELSNAANQTLVIRPLSMSFCTRHGVRSVLETESALVVFSRLGEAARAGEEVTYFAINGAEADFDSLAALNCYLRSARAMGRMHMPWTRINRFGVSRYAWAAFCHYLGLEFR